MSKKKSAIMRKLMIYITIAILLNFTSAIAETAPAASGTSADGYNKATGELAPGATLTGFKGTVKPKGACTINGINFAAGIPELVIADDGSFKIAGSTIRFKGSSNVQMTAAGEFTIDGTKIKGSNIEAEKSGTGTKFAITGQGSMNDVPIANAQDIIAESTSIKGKAKENCIVSGIGFNKDSEFLFDTAKKIMFPSKKEAIFGIGGAFEGTISSAMIKDGDKSISIPQGGIDGNVVNIVGNVKMKQGIAYVASGDKAKIDDIVIDNTVSKNDLMIIIKKTISPSSDPNYLAKPPENSITIYPLGVALLRDSSSNFNFKSMAITKKDGNQQIIGKGELFQVMDDSMILINTRQNRVNIFNGKVRMDSTGMLYDNGKMYAEHEGQNVEFGGKQGSVLVVAPDGMVAIWDKGVDYFFREEFVLNYDEGYLKSQIEGPKEEKTEPAPKEGELRTALYRKSSTSTISRLGSNALRPDWDPDVVFNEYMDKYGQEDPLSSASVTFAMIKDSDDPKAQFGKYALADYMYVKNEGIPYSFPPVGVGTQYAYAQSGLSDCTVEATNSILEYLQSEIPGFTVQDFDNIGSQYRSPGTASVRGSTADWFRYMEETGGAIKHTGAGGTKAINGFVNNDGTPTEYFKDHCSYGNCYATPSQGGGHAVMLVTDQKKVYTVDSSNAYVGTGSAVGQREFTPTGRWSDGMVLEVNDPEKIVDYMESNKDA